MAEINVAIETEEAIDFVGAWLTQAANQGARADWHGLARTARAIGSVAVTLAEHEAAVAGREFAEAPREPPSPAPAERYWLDETVTEGKTVYAVMDSETGLAAGTPTLDEAAARRDLASFNETGSDFPGLRRHYEPGPEPERPDQGA